MQIYLTYEKQIFNFIFLNINISLIYEQECLKTSMHVAETHKEGSMSQPF